MKLALNLDFRRAIAVVACCAAAALLPACALFKGSDPRPKPVELAPNAALFGIQRVWTANIGTTAGLPLQVSVHGNDVTLASTDGAVVSIDAARGEVRWRVKVPQGLSAGVGSDGRWSAVVSKDNQLTVLDLGKVIWKHRLGAQTYTAPLVAGDRVFVLTADRAITAFDAQSGALLWARPGGGEPLVLRQAGVLMSADDTLVAGIGGRLVGIDPNSGDTRWQATLANPRGANDVERLVEIVAPANRVQTNLCARAFQASVACFDFASGRVLWAQRADGSSGVAGDSEAVFGTESNGTVRAWSRSTGERAWSIDSLRYRNLSAPLLLGRSVVVGDGTGLVHFLSREDGSSLNRLPTDGSAISVAPVVAADTLVVVTKNGGVFGFRPN